MTKPVFGVDYQTTEQALNLAQQQSGRSMGKLVKDLLYYAGQSAVKLTPPGGSTLKGLPKKYKVRPLKKGYVKVWNKKLNKFTWRKLTNKNRQIPGAGAAKAGWVHALRDVGNMQAGGEGLTSKLGFGKITGGPMSGYLGLLNNIVKYGPKIASSVPAQAVRTAERRLLGKLWRNEKEKIVRAAG